MLGKLIPSFIKQKIIKFIREQARVNFEPQMVFMGDLQQRLHVSNTAALFNKENIFFGKNIFIWHYSILDGTAPLTIGDGCQIGGWVGIFTHSHSAARLYGYHYFNIPDHEKQAMVIEPVTIGAFTAIAPHCIIMPGTKIGKGCLIKPYSHIPFGAQIPDFSVVEGNPAKVVDDTRRIDSFYLKNNPQLKEFYESWANKTL